MGYHKIGAVDRVFLMISVCTFIKILKKELILSTKKNIHIIIAFHQGTKKLMNECQNYLCNKVKGNIKIARLIKFYLHLILTHQDFMP